jgi:hypothetical protein
LPFEHGQYVQDTGITSSWFEHSSSMLFHKRQLFSLSCNKYANMEEGKSTILVCFTIYKPCLSALDLDPYPTYCKQLHDHSFFMCLAWAWALEAVHVPRHVTDIGNPPHQLCECTAPTLSSEAGPGSGLHNVLAAHLTDRSIWHLTPCNKMLFVRKNKICFHKRAGPSNSRILLSVSIFESTTNYLFRGLYNCRTHGRFVF